MASKVGKHVAALMLAPPSLSLVAVPDPQACDSYRRIGAA